MFLSKYERARACARPHGPGQHMGWPIPYMSLAHADMVFRMLIYAKFCYFMLVCRNG